MRARDLVLAASRWIGVAAWLAQAAAAAAAPDAAPKPGSFSEWDRALSAACDERTPHGRTSCAQVKIDKALAEGRLRQADVAACAEGSQPGIAQSPQSQTERDLRQQERQARRRASLGGDAYWNWSTLGCDLANRVRQTFQEATPETAPRRAGAAAERGATAALDPRQCEILPHAPQCRQGRRPAQRETYRSFAAGAHADCVAAGGAGPRDRCAREVVEQAIAARLVSAQAVQGCRDEWSVGRREAPEHAEVYECLGRRAMVEEASASLVVRSAPRSSVAAWRTDGYRRADTLAAIQAADWPHVPARPDDGAYFLNAFGQLNAACPALGLSSVALRLAEAAVQNMHRSVTRAASGQGSMGDLATVLGGANELLKAMRDCDSLWHDEPRQNACLAERDSAFSMPQSVDARRDVALLLSRHRCDGPETRTFAKNLSTWLLLSPDQRYAMSWALGDPKAAEYDAIFENCRRQAGEGAADAWCGCYVRRYSLTRVGSRAAPLEAMQAVRVSAFIGEQGAFFVPADLDECRPQRERLTAWRRTQGPSQTVTACLARQAPMTAAVTPDLKACTYRTAWGEVEWRQPECVPRLYSGLWGGDAVACP
ncbi:MAG TPA: hypothetical protein PLO41_12080 [Rubrivivax sp.]|nr:hypothetical protein [Rubrivivax sp.]